MSGGGPTVPSDCQWNGRCSRCHVRLGCRVEVAVSYLGNHQVPHRLRRDEPAELLEPVHQCACGVPHDRVRRVHDRRPGNRERWSLQQRDIAGSGHSHTNAKSIPGTQSLAVGRRGDGEMPNGSREVGGAPLHRERQDDNALQCSVHDSTLRRVGICLVEEGVRERQRWDGIYPCRQGEYGAVIRVLFESHPTHSDGPDRPDCIKRKVVDLHPFDVRRGVLRARQKAGVRELLYAQGGIVRNLLANKHGTRQRGHGELHGPILGKEQERGQHQYHQGLTDAGVPVLGAPLGAVNVCCPIELTICSASRSGSLSGSTGGSEGGSSACHIPLGSM